MSACFPARHLLCCYVDDAPTGGCLNLSAENARWFYEFPQPGDVVEIRNTAGQPLELWQNGEWSVPWQEWLQGSALRA
jgi:hypothetical protein